MKNFRLPVLFMVLVLGALFVSPVMAGPTYTFSVSSGTQPSNAGVITLTQNGSNSVNVLVDLINPTYGFLNTGGPHTPFAFNIAGSQAVSIVFTTPAGGTFGSGVLSMNTAGGDNTPFGTFGIAIDSSAGNGSGNAYFGDLAFTLTRATGLSTDDFVTNGVGGYYFSADLTNGENTGAQAWQTRTGTSVPEPSTLTLLGTALVGFGVLRRRFTGKA